MPTMDETRLAQVAPELRDALQMFGQGDPSALAERLQESRAAMAQMPRPPVAPELQAVQVEERRVPGLNGAPDVRLLLYTPPQRASAPRPAILHVHGGGYVMGDPELNDGMNRAICLEADCVIASVDYRLAPETTFPGSLEDCFAGLQWLAEQAGTLGIDRGRIAVAGESAGGGHAAALAIYARDRGGPDLCLQLLDSPMLDDRTGAREPHPHAGHFVWTHETNRFGWASLLGQEPGSTDLPGNCSPARVEDLSGLPPTFISVGALDLFLDESLDYTRRLARAGVQVELHVIPGAYHGYSMAAGSPQAAQNNALRMAALKRAFAA
jgi:triacylglycerol lipase